MGSGGLAARACERHVFGIRDLGAGADAEALVGIGGLATWAVVRIGGLASWAVVGIGGLATWAVVGEAFEEDLSRESSSSSESSYKA